MSDKERGYAHRVDILADAREVWRALTDNQQLTQWCSPDADIRARAGGVGSMAETARRRVLRLAACGLLIFGRRWAPLFFERRGRILRRGGGGGRRGLRLLILRLTSDGRCDERCHKGDSSEQRNE